MRIDEIVTTIKNVLDNDTTLSTNFPTLVVTHQQTSSPTEEVITDFPFVTIRYISEVTVEAIGEYVDRDVNDDPVEGIFRDGYMTLFCWDETETNTNKLADYCRDALFRNRHANEGSGLLDIMEWDVGESTPSRGFFDGFRAIVRFRVLVKRTIT